ncbi:MAG: thioredoxin domain-containing protein [Nitrospirae bacterium]|nr:thioredoxin domain-containing protein [Nitrospirota bacterium]
MEYKHTNRLITEISPYLLQHSHNPVDWYPWGNEAFNKAKSEDKPILLSIGYSACHWCHVMERESFENEEIASIMNRLFINIKVDREERPDIDDLYQYSLRLFGGNGGWPLTMFLTPEAKPFFGGSYFPPEERQGMQAFPDVLNAISEAYSKRKNEIKETTAEIINTLTRIQNKPSAEETLNIADLDNASSRLLRYVDPNHGGFGTAPKFPPYTQINLLLRYYKRSGDQTALDVVINTLRNMAGGGIYDQIGGGFHRYTVDERWRIPHFEKMLYDNVLLARLYFDAYKVTSDTGYKNIGEETLSYLLREMYLDGKGFYSSQDADSEGGEGKFFVWSKQEIESVTGKEAEVISRFYGVTEDGNFEGKNILYMDRGMKAVSHEFDIPEEKVREILNRGKEALFTKREGRVKPFTDTKILTGWNGLAVSAFAEGYRTTGKAIYLDAARSTINFIRTELFKDGKLLHVWRDGISKGNADINDYAFLIAALIDMYEITFEDDASILSPLSGEGATFIPPPLTGGGQGEGGWKASSTEYLNWADKLTSSIIELFWDKEKGGFFNSADDEDVRLFHRMKTATDQPVPSGNATALTDLLRLTAYKDKPEYRIMAEKLIRIFYDEAIENPFSFSSLLSGVYFFLEGAVEITIVGKQDCSDVKEIISKLRGCYISDMVIYLVGDTGGFEVSHYIPEFAKGKTAKDGKPAVYICKNFTCSEPLNEWEDIKKLF